MKYIKIFILIVACMISSVQAQVQSKRVALLTSPIQNPYVGAMNASFIKTLEPLGVKVTNLTTPYDAAIQSQQVDDSIGQKFDLIAIQVTNHIAIIPALERALKAKIPVVLLVAPLETGHENLYTSVAGNDQAELGRIAAKQMIKALGDKPSKIAIIEGTPTQLFVQARTTAFKQEISKAKNIQIVAVEAANWRTDLSENIARQLFVRFASQGGLQGIFAMADNMAFGVIQAAESAGVIPGKDLVVVSSTCQKEGLINIKNGKQFSAVDQVPVREGQFSAKVVAKVLKGEVVKKNEIITAQAVDLKNIDEYISACTF
jgi:ribose transport system substrate-binding protein